jgi:hypothetical protein
VVRGVYLDPPATEFVEACRRAADAVSFAAPCPALVPSRTSWSCVPCPASDDSAFVLQGEGWGRPEGSGIEGLHLVVAASPNRTAAALSCTGAAGRGEVEVRGATGRLVRCPTGSELHSGHLLLAWRENGVFRVVSLHGLEPRDAAILLAIADSFGRNPLQGARHSRGLASS